MRIGAVQRFPIFDDVNRAIEAIASDAMLADARGLDLALFPEAYLQGHSYDRALIELRAVSVDDPIVLMLLDRLSRAQAVVIVGFFERRGASIFNSAMVIDKGRLTGVYAKAFPIEDGCVPGDHFPTWRNCGRTFGINICNDLNYPEAAERLTRQGTELIVCPINMMLRPKKAERWRVPALESLQDCARRTGCWVMSSDVVGQGAQGWLSYGCTAIVRPDGTVAARASELVEDMAVFDLPWRMA